MSGIGESGQFQSGQFKEYERLLSANSGRSVSYPACQYQWLKYALPRGRGL